MLVRSARSRRPAVILMVVLALLTLFALVGIAFVFYAQQQHMASHNWRLARWTGFTGSAGSGNPPPSNGGTTISPPDINPASLLRFGLAQIIYDVADDDSGIYSAIRGHSLARSLYGYNDQTLNIQPFNGTGRLHNVIPNLGDDYHLINYTYFPGGALRDPERYGLRPNPTTRMPWTGGYNAPYTYPDLNNMYLGASQAYVNPTTSTLLTQSFHRSWLFNAPTTPNGQPRPLNDTSNPNWTNAIGRYLTLRPRPEDHRLNANTPPRFPYPADATGDVKNRVGAPGGNDSLWMDMDYPMVISEGGIKFKPLFAWYVEDLDNRLDVNVHGNIMQGNRLTPQTPPNPSTNQHGSNQGWGRWEVSLARLLNADALEWKNVFLGDPTDTLGLRPAGRYGRNKVPDSRSGSAIPGYFPRTFAQVDFDGTVEWTGAATQRMQLPTNSQTPVAGSTALPRDWSYPLFPTGYANGTGQPGTTTGERDRHAATYDYFQPKGPPLGPTPPATTPAWATLPGTPWDDERFPVSDMAALLFSDLSTASLPYSQIGQLLPLNLSGPTNATAAQRNAATRRRTQITTLTMDLARMGGSPWLLDRTTSGYVAAAQPDQMPAGSRIPFPALSARTSPLPASSEMTADWRARDPMLEKIDLNRKMAAYPHQTGTTTYETRFEDFATQFLLAHYDRQQLAREIYDRLVAATGAVVPDPAVTPAPTDQQLEPLRHLAQLAVNIVDFIDEDEISTPFLFYTSPAAGYNPSAGVTNPVTNEVIPRYWVFGQEYPSVVLNEALIEYVDPTPAQPPMAGQTVTVPATHKCWVELYSPLRAEGTNVQGQDSRGVQLYLTPRAGDPRLFSVYKVVVANTTQAQGAGGLFDSRFNVLGAPDQIRTEVEFNDSPITPIEGTTILPQRVPSNGFLLVGPPDEQAAPRQDVRDTIRSVTAGGRVPDTTPFYKTDKMAYRVQATVTGGTPPTIAYTPDDRTAGLSVLLRRLANPHLPPENDPTRTATLPPARAGEPNRVVWLYNPYVTVDYLQAVPPNLAPATNPTTSGAIYRALGKRQPLTSHPSQVAPQNPQGMNDRTRHTFGLANEPRPQNPETGAGSRYEWLVHLDRKLVSPLELLHVSCYRPHDVLKKFWNNTNLNGNNGKFNHRTPWFDEDLVAANLARQQQNPPQPPLSHRLWRFFGHVEVKDRMAGVSLRGRVPGRLNINTIWDPEILLALADPQAANFFTVANLYRANYNPPNTNPTPAAATLADANSPIWHRILASRTPGLINGGMALSGSDRPFWDFLVGDQHSDDPQAAYASGVNEGRGLNSTLLRSANIGGLGNDRRLFETPVSIVQNVNHPYLRFELINKLLPHLTTRSNVFAVWLTVGFFEVLDDTTRPMKLGAEIGAANGTNIRHRFFCIVDRTQLTLAEQFFVLQNVIDPFAGNSNGEVTVNVTVAGSTPVGTNGLQVGTITYAGTTTPLPVVLTKGTILLVDEGDNQETVVVENVDAVNRRFTATFTRRHNIGAKFTIPGNPGPQPNFDYNDPRYWGVVPYYTIVPGS